MEQRLTALRAAAAQYIPPDAADELARNLAQVAADDELNFPIVLELVLHRREHFGLSCDPYALTVALCLAAQVQVMVMA